MNEIKIENQNEIEDRWEFSVTVEGKEFSVTVDKEYYEQLTDGEVQPEELVKASFDFLLEREPVSAILPDFNLQVIEGYFPEYSDEIRKSWE